MKIKALDEAAWSEWVTTRPESVQQLASMLPPDRLYRLKTTGHRGVLYSYSENGTVSLAVTGEYNFVLFDRHVFGIKPEDIEECDLPAPEELLGTMLTDDKDIERFAQSYLPP